ncbi:halocyanin domain-containing protein [Halorarius litoreus]|uniref:halocyanin domain-containing protein n=1 Tax=Halorarius litoreus TaxID=2962676 RepID=UPI0020CF7EBF|nr:halocyanin domain-containing protein [Halorarius litoreus]
MSDRETYDRRTVLAATTAAAATALAGCSGGSSTSADPPEESTDSPTPTEASSGSGGSGGTQSFDGWMENVGNYEEVVDATGQSEVSVTVGAEANGGAFGFGPAAVRVSSGTTVVWEWNGKGGSHNVVAKGGAFESDMHGSEGATFEYTFEESGTTKYSCAPHETMGMKGVVVVE